MCNYMWTYTRGRPLRCGREEWSVFFSASPERVQAAQYNNWESTIGMICSFYVATELKLAPLLCCLCEILVSFVEPLVRPCLSRLYILNSFSKFSLLLPL